jgi:hypothetical protein
MTRYRIVAFVAAAMLLLAPGIGGADNATAETHAIVELREQCLLGGARDQKWIPADKFEKNLKGPLKAQLFTLDGPGGEIVLNKGGESDCPHSIWSAKRKPELKNGVAIQAPSWNPLPRLPQAIDPKDEAYVQIVSDILKAAGIKKPDVRITQGYKIDLDGDGNDEVVIAANRYAKGMHELSGTSNETSPGDYTLVVVRKKTGDKVENIFVVKAVWLKAEEGPLARGNHISAIADLNGDGTMEIVMYSAYHEGSDSDVVEIKGNKANAVIGCACEH